MAGYRITLTAVLGLASIISIGGCTKSAREEIVTAVTPVAPLVKPRPPFGAPSGLNVPKPDASGNYATVNSGAGAQESLWHLRAAFNVAALSCRENAALASSYNGFIGRNKAVLALAYADERARLGEAGLDQHSTRVYNFFAQPQPQRAFCRAVATELTAVATIPPNTLASGANAALARVEAPFTDFYRGYNRYLGQLARWEASPNKAGPAASLALGGSDGAGAAELEKIIPNVPTLEKWSIQIGAFTGRAAAESAWEQARGQAPGLARYTPRYEAVPGNPALVRLRLGAEDDRDGAVRLCAAAATGGFDCIAVPKG